MSTDISIECGDYVTISTICALNSPLDQFKMTVQRFFGQDVLDKIIDHLSELDLSGIAGKHPPLRVLEITQTPNGLPQWVVVSGDYPGLPEPISFKAKHVRLLHRPKFDIGDEVALVKNSDIKELKKGHRGKVEKTYFRIYDVKFEGLEYTISTSEDDLELTATTELKTEPEEGNDTMEREATSFRLSFYNAQKGRNRPSANLFQLTGSKLAELKNEPEWKLTADGSFGTGTKKVARAIQVAYRLGDDGVVGKGTWRAITPDLGTWRPPLRLRIAECQCSWEAGRKGYEYMGVIPREGWWNYGIWNVNRGSARTLVTLGGASHLMSKINAADKKWREYAVAYKAAGKNEKFKVEARKIREESRVIAAEVAHWFGSKDGRKLQVGSYFLKNTIRPSIRNLVKVGFDIQKLGFDDLDQLKSIYHIDELDEKLATVSPFYERLILQACDITVNSGPGGYFPKKTPRAWQSTGSLAWPEDKLPFREEVKAVYAKTFGGNIPNDYTYIRSDTRDTYRDALKRCLWEICETDEQRIALIAELQSRCIVNHWRDEIIRRRRAVAWPEGFNFQSAFFCVPRHFGIGI